jgi:prophage maintenance system killer protein
MIIKNIINYFLYIILFFNCIIQSKKLYGDSLSYIDNLIFEAQSKKLWDKRAWIKLLLIPDHFFYNNKRSLISDNSYFLAPDGKYNPENELILKHSMSL